MRTEKLFGILVAILAGISGCANPVIPPADPTPDTVPPTETYEPVVVEVTPSEPARPDPATIRLTIAAAGDMMLGTDFPENRLPDDDANDFLTEVAPYFASADIAFGNLEGVLLDGGEPAKKCSNPRACYLFRSPTRYAAHLAATGFDVMSLANNHARDFGEAGRDSTMKALESHGIRHSGREGDIASWEVNGLRVALIAFAVTRNSFSMLDITDAAFEVADLSREHDLVLVSFHGGAEGLDALHIPFADETYYNEPRGDVVAFSRAMVDAGADAVIGHGPHVVRAIERYQDRLIAYSLGNFATYYGISVAGLKGVAPILEITIDGNGKFIGGRLIATHQLRPSGPTLDPARRAIQEVQRLSRMDFGTPGVRIDDDGTLTPVSRPAIRAAQAESLD